ncbi:uncharacterized protein EV422DRAFT_99044 [Fimicolochytrium jonesii]|uniref:uncharacterized protein n=1 Tax=Fimicolochytrium jonesii TaxID=1396493 RepID=UPI0022FE6FF2|nr:uncharacterized protein EV422DRAFT_99044 [Fimicolochytrium jonesii]KAI8819612.1 hypothetical protein EV422DRAFT_99044 [Fimicolochytrium jonesii]
MYCHRNLEIRTAEPLTPTALHSASPISPPPRAALASGEIDTERLANDMITAADVATVLLEMIAAGGDAEVLQQLYDQTKSFQGVLENLVSQTTAKLNEDVMMRILSTNDVLLAAIDAYTQHLTTPPPSSRPSRGATPSPARPKSTVEASSQPSSSSSRPSTWHGGAQLPIQPPSESSLKHKRDLSLSNLSDLDLLESIGDDMGHVGKGDGLHVRPQPSSRMNSELDDQVGVGTNSCVFCILFFGWLHCPGPGSITLRKRYQYSSHS